MSNVYHYPSGIITGITSRMTRDELGQDQLARLEKIQRHDSMIRAALSDNVDAELAKCGGDTVEVTLVKLQTSVLLNKAKGSRSEALSMLMLETMGKVDEYLKQVAAEDAKLDSIEKAKERARQGQESYWTTPRSFSVATKMVGAERGVSDAELTPFMTQRQRQNIDLNQAATDAALNHRHFQKD